MDTGLIQLRNEMAHYIRRSSEKSTFGDNEERDWPFGRLPRPINNERTCAGCPQLLACAIYQRSVFCFFDFDRIAIYFSCLGL